MTIGQTLSPQAPDTPRFEPAGRAETVGAWAEQDPLRRTLHQLIGTPWTGGNRVTQLINGDRFFPAMLQAIDQAQRDIVFATFVYWRGDIADRFADALAAAARRGVRVRVVLDALGARTMRRELLDRMRQAGVEIRWFRPLWRWDLWKIDRRMHRKVLVCDRRVGFAGGAGIAHEWEGDARDPSERRDTHFRIEGPAVACLMGAFLATWLRCGGSIDRDTEPPPCEPCDGQTHLLVVAGASPVESNDVAIMHRSLFNLATRRIRIVTPYLYPDRTVIRCLGQAIDRGVTVELLIPGDRIDKRLAKFAADAQIAGLLEIGVHVWRYRPTMIHAKLITIDGRLSCFGSANLNFRSIAKDEELSLIADDTQLASELDRAFEEDLVASEAVTARRLHRLSLWRRAIGAATVLFKGEM